MGEAVRRIDGVDHRGDGIGLLDHAHIFLILLGMLVKIVHEALEVIVADRVGEGSDVLLFHQRIAFRLDVLDRLHG